VRTFDVIRNRTKITVLVVGLACCAAAIKADGPGHSFTSLTSPYTQELYGVTANPVVIGDVDGFIGGVAFTPTGDVWAPECGGYTYHRFDRLGSTPDGHGGAVHPESLVDLSTYAPAPTGCGVVNHGSPYMGIETMFANTYTGLWPIEAATGTPILGGPLNSVSTHAGNGRGIDLDPLSVPTNHVVYLGADCDPALRPTAVACTVFDYNLTNPATLAFARFHRTATESFESLYFAPDGNSVFVSYRDSAAGTQGLAVIRRPAALISNRNTIDDSQIVRRIAMSAMPQGVAFRAAGDFAVTLNEDGTMTRLTFPSVNFDGAPTQSSFASGGFRGGLLRVGADGCIYAPQGRMDGGTSGVRFGDNAVASSDSIVRVCGGFAPAPGVAGAAWTPEPGSISGSTYVDYNRNGIKDASEPGLSNVQISLSGADTGAAVSDSNGSYTLPNVLSGLYSVSAPVSFSGLVGNPTPLAVDLGSGEQRVGVDFPYSESTQPVCTATTPSGTPTRVDLTLRDGSGLRRVVVRAVSNFQVSVRGGAAVTSPTTVNFTSPVTGDVSVNATRSNSAQAASVELDVVDAFGNQVSCAASVPASTTPPPNPPTTPVPPKPEPPKPQPPKPEPPKPSEDPIRRELTGQGRFDIEVAKHVAHTMKYVAIRNGKRGLESVEVFVNHRWFLTGRLRDGQVKTIDVSRALLPGTKNKIVLVGRGARKDSAVVTISSKP
jgi:hypothetical protein